jgi:hypothetical protein
LIGIPLESASLRVNYKSGQLGKGGVEIPRLFDRYQKGYHQEVYDELLAMHEGVFGEDIYEDALLVARAIMRRVRHNIELLIPRLHEIGYHIKSCDILSI